MTTTKPMDDDPTLRDMFALEAMGRAMDLSPPQWWNEGISPIRGTPEMDRVAKVAYAMADAMLKARTQEEA